MALGDYRGPLSAKALMRYIDARMKLAERDEICRIHATEHLRVLVGSNVSYAELVGFDEGVYDFDAEQVVDDVISRAGLEVVE